MRPLHFLRLACLLLVFVAVGCASNNKGKIEGTRWTSEKTYYKGHYLPEGSLGLEFRKDGSLVYRIGTRFVTGNYKLGWGDTVTFHLDQALANGNTHTEQVVIKGSRLTITDPDGTQGVFRKR